MRLIETFRKMKNLNLNTLVIISNIYAPIKIQIFKMNLKTLIILMFIKKQH